MQTTSEFVVHVSIRAVVLSAISLGTIVAGGAWNIAASNTHVAEALRAIEATDHRQEQVLQSTAVSSKANAARLDVVDNRISRLESDVSDLRQQQNKVGK